MGHNYNTINNSVDFPNPSAPYIDKAFLQAVLTELGNSSVDTAGDIPMTGALRQLFAGMIAQQGPLGGLGIRHYADVLPQQTGMVEWGIMFNVPLDFVTLPTPFSVSSLTRVGSVATATIPGNTFSNGDMITFAGANQPEYNGTFAIYGKSGSNVSYTIAGTPVTPATGTITATNSSTPWGGRDIAAPCLALIVPESVTGLQLWYAPTGLAGTVPMWGLALDLNAVDQSVSGVGKIMYNFVAETADTNATPAGTIKKKILVGKSGSLLSSFRLSGTVNGGNIGYGLYRNGVLVGTSKVVTTGFPAQTYTDFTSGWINGDLAEIRITSNATSVGTSVIISEWALS